MWKICDSDPLFKPVTLTTLNTKEQKHMEMLMDSELPLKEPSAVETKSTEVVNVFKLKHAPLTCSMIVQETMKDPTLAHAYEASLKVWKYTDNPNLEVYYAHKDQLTRHQGCVMWGGFILYLANFKRVSCM